MIKITHKIKAFTLTEIMVVIVISAIVAGLAFSVLGVIQKNLRSIEDNYAYQTKLQSLEVVLTIDFNKYTQATWNQNSDQLILSSPIDQRTYHFYTDSIVTDIDTYMVKTKQKTFYMEGTKVGSGSIDAIKLTFENTTNLHRIFVFKHNDPSIHF